MRYTSDSEPGISRRRYGKGFAYRYPNGRPVKDKAVLARIRKLAIPPAYTDVWICRSDDGHLQATGRDARGRKQYRYHTKYRERREATKYDHMLEFAAALPAIRRRVREDMGKRGLPRDKVLATVVNLLEATMIRVGSADYARQNKSYGLTTLRDRHVKVNGSELKFRFTGKSGKVWSLSLRDRRVARIVRQSQELPGQSLFQYLDDEGQRCEVTSGNVNDYLREISGRDITAKDFRTWVGTVHAAHALAELGPCDSEAEARRNINSAIAYVADKLGNTSAICRKCYVHPDIIDAYLANALKLDSRVGRNAKDLRREEAVVLAFLRKDHASASERQPASHGERKSQTLSAAN